MPCQCNKSYDQCYGPEDASGGMYSSASKRDPPPSNPFLHQVEVAGAVVFFISYMVTGSMKDAIIISSAHAIAHYWSAGGHIGY